MSSNPQFFIDFGSQFHQQSYEDDMSDQKTLQELNSTYSELSLNSCKQSPETCLGYSQNRLSQVDHPSSSPHSVFITHFFLDNLQQNDDSLCTDFHEKGFCFKGKLCSKHHILSVDDNEIKQKKRSAINWILSENPQILLMRKRRMNNFLQ